MLFMGGEGSPNLAEFIYVWVTVVGFGMGIDSKVCLGKILNIFKVF